MPLVVQKHFPELTWHTLAWLLHLQAAKDKRQKENSNIYLKEDDDDGVGKLKFKHLLALRHSRSVLKSVQFLIAMTSLDFLLLELLCTFTNLKNHHYFHITC